MTATACHLCGSMLESNGINVGCVEVAHQARTGSLLTVACSECSLVQTLPHPTAEEVRDYYASGTYRQEFPDLPRYELDENLEPTGRTVLPTDEDYELTCDRHGEHAAKRLIEMLGIGDGVRVLEVGCGDGRVSAALKARGVDIRAIEWDNAKAKARGVDVVNPDEADMCTLGAGQDPEADAVDRVDTVPHAHLHDLVFALQVAEHFADPIGELWENLVRYAKPGGTVFVEVPTVERPYVDLTHFLQRPHVVNYSTHTLGAAMKRAGLVDVMTAIDGSVLLGIGKRGPDGPQPYKPHGGPLAAEMVGKLQAWDRRQRETATAQFRVERFERMMATQGGIETREGMAGLYMDDEEAAFILSEWHRWRKMASDAAGELHGIVTALEEAKREDWHPDPWVRGFLAGRIHEGQRLGVALGHVLNGLALNLNRKDPK